MSSLLSVGGGPPLRDVWNGLELSSHYRSRPEPGTKGPSSTQATETKLTKGNTMMATQAGAGPARRWPRIAVVLAAVFVLMTLVAVYFALKPPPTPAATPSPMTSTATSPPPSPSVTGAPTVLADGCLGGTDPIKAIRIAHDKAPLTPEGGAAFVATMVRWLGQAPHDPVEFQQTGKLIWAPALPATNRQMPVSRDGATAWVSTEDARYRITKVTAADVTVEAVFLQTISENSTKTDVEHVGRFTVTQLDGRWAFKAAAPGGPNPEQVVSQLQAEGLPYRGGC